MSYFQILLGFCPNWLDPSPDGELGLGLHNRLITIDNKWFKNCFQIYKIVTKFGKLALQNFWDKSFKIYFVKSIYRDITFLITIVFLVLLFSLILKRNSLLHFYSNWTQKITEISFSKKNHRNFIFKCFPIFLTDNNFVNCHNGSALLMWIFFLQILKIAVSDNFFLQIAIVNHFLQALPIFVPVNGGFTNCCCV